MNEKYKKVVVYVKERDYLILRSKLIFLGKSFSQWIREQIQKFIGTNPPLDDTPPKDTPQ